MSPDIIRYNILFKPMSKRSRNYTMYTENRWLVGMRLQSFFWMDLRGKPEITVESRRLREPVRYQKGAYDGMHDEWSYYIRQLGWHRRSI